ncbi:hypothetical protein CRM22_008437 [Opisthorchis felineus]|uniref:Uncharacterized protein n=1 Tax=Opisthorchis felineus TaxID=147828 RepID=A0A4S2LBZ1_OPIFE|nr:hypothetical protein CRM22_008437 [Opisthorchis felineus]
MFRLSLLLLGLSVITGFSLSYLAYQIIATVVDPKGSELPLDEKYDVISGTDHLLMEARLCIFVEKAFKRGKMLHKLQFTCDLHGRRDEKAVLGVHFRKDQFTYLKVSANNSGLGQEIMRTTKPIPQMFGLKQVSAQRETKSNMTTEKPKAGAETGRNLCLSTLVLIILNIIR